MAQYKVPQDVEADDKLIGPFSFRQFVYLMITAGLGGIGFLLFKVFPLLVIIPAPFMLFFIILALPLKKDQPMETYLSAIVSFYMKPRTRLWVPGQGETTIVITAPKHSDEVRTKGLSEEEAVHRLSFLADIVDTEGYAIKGDGTTNNMRSDFYGEASQAQDIFEKAQQNANYQNLNDAAQTRHDELVNQMRNAIDNNNSFNANHTTINHIGGEQIQAVTTSPAPAPVSPNITSSFTPNITTAPVQPQAPTMPTPPTIPQFTNTKPAQPATPVIPTNPFDAKDGIQSSVIIQPDDTIFDSAPQAEPMPTVTPEPVTAAAPAPEPTLQSAPEPAPAPAPSQPDPAIVNLANNNDLSIETLAKQAKRIEEKHNNNGEVYISLH